MFNQDFKAEPAWSISSGHRASRPEAFLDFNSWKALANSSGKKSPEIHLLGGVGILQSCDSSLTTSLSDSRFVVLYTYSILNQLRGSRVGSNRAEAACVSGFAKQVVNYTPCQPTGVHDVDVIDSLGPAIFSFFIKMGHQGKAAELVVLPCRARRKTW